MGRVRQYFPVISGFLYQLFKGLTHWKDAPFPSLRTHALSFPPYLVTISVFAPFLQHL